MQKEKQLVPKLRFPKFERGWKKIRLGDFIQIKSGNSPSSFDFIEEGKYPFIKVEELNNCDKYQVNSRFYSNSTKNLVAKNSILFPKRGAAILNNKIRISSIPLLMDSNMMALECDNSQLNFEFLYYKILKDKLYKIADTSTIPQLNNKHIQPYKLYVSSLPEQQKIANFLTAIDTQIQTLEKKKTLLEQYKKGVMQKIFKQEIRFKDEDGNDFAEWEVKRLGEVFEEIRNKVGKQNIETYSISAGKGFISQKEKFGKDISGKQNEKYIVVENNQFSYNKGNSKTYKYGCVYLNRTAQNIAVPNVFISFKKRLNEVDQSFYEQYFIGHNLDRDLRKMISSSARMDGLLNISKQNFFDIKIPVPSKKEQSKIANFLSAIDKEIALVNNKIERTKNYKKGLLQQMFV